MSADQGVLPVPELRVVPALGVPGLYDAELVDTAGNSERTFTDLTIGQCNYVARQRGAVVVEVPR